MNLTQKKVYLETFGCQMNVSDSERVAARLHEQGFEMVSDQSSADVVLLNTCSVRERAEQKLYTRVGEIRSNIKRGIGGLRQPLPVRETEPLIGVMGCVAQLEGENLLDNNNRIDFVIGTRAVGRIGEVIIEQLAGHAPQVDLDERESAYDWNVAPAQRHSPYVAFVPIIEGCNKFCTYCIVPFARGREQSRTPAEIISEIVRLRGQGYHEVHLIGQNVNSYRPRSLAGLEDYSGATPFVKLLRAVAATGMERIKFTTSFPRDFHPEIIDVFNQHENLCDWVHLPVQSGSNAVLRAMRRGHDRAAYLRIIEKIKESPRRLALTSDLIVGFPGETDQDFQDSVELVKECQFDSLYIFKYSPRTGTPAASLPHSIPADVIQQRFLEIEIAQRTGQKLIYEDYVGRTLQVLVEKISPKNEADVNGHSTCQKVVNFSAGRENLGKILPVEISAAKSNSLYGQLKLS